MQQSIPEAADVAATPDDERRDLSARRVPSLTGELEGNVRTGTQRKKLLGLGMHILEASQPSPIGLYPKVEALLVAHLVLSVPWLDGADGDFAPAHDWGTGQARIEGTPECTPIKWRPARAPGLTDLN